MTQHYLFPSSDCESANSRTTSNLPPTCSQASSRHSGVQRIHPQSGFSDPFEVFCDQDYEGGGWIVIQNRYQGSVHFNRGWRDYERGFGNIAGEFWLGLRKIHELTYSNRYELRVLLEDWDGTRAVARYSDFLVAGPEDKYQLRSLGSFSGDAGDSMSYNLNMSFSTFDEDNDAVPSNCAVSLKGAWWYRDCSLR
ncbi:LOW QUALITY PROTEIN: microfibril-associated glycoprotein 4-like [Culex quinquefasciatus]|uniref:LOW QUALITY PROTEIN: microfibril-associated glycoprotein 4-like n=1 Tax=Culex quinquefasciatus TaxID=7176 RepID=UPI0018E3B79E|nr:LOW QUALITY PROTEIN: microfibril-associated glycoprotein 4-like [Culex quinquefasciatus]